MTTSKRQGRHYRTNKQSMMNIENVRGPINEVAMGDTMGLTAQQTVIHQIEQGLSQAKNKAAGKLLSAGLNPYIK